MRLDVRSVLLTVLFSTAAFHAPAAQSTKPVRSYEVHTDGGPGTPTTLEEFWKIAETVALIEVVSSEPDDRQISLPDGTQDTIVKTLSRSNIVELFKPDTNGAPISIDIELRGGRRERANRIDDYTDPRIRQLVVGQRYVVFVRHIGKGTHVVPVTADGNSILEIRPQSVASAGRSPLVGRLVTKSPEALLDALRALKGRR